MPIAINSAVPVIAAQTVAADVVLQPGAVIDATVQKVLEANLVRIAIANLSVDVMSEVPLKAGQTLQLSVSQTPQGVKLAIVPPNNSGAALPAAVSSGDVATTTSGSATNVAANIAAAKLAPQIDNPTNIGARPLTNLEALAVSAAVQSAAARQGSLAPLFANLGVAAGSSALPPALQEAAVKLLSLRPGLNGGISGDDIKAAFEKSGLFLEQSLAAKATAPSTRQTAQGDTPDLKAALIAFRQTVASWLGDAAPAGSAQPSEQTAPQSSPSNSANAPDAAQQKATTQQTISPSLAPSSAASIEADEILLPQTSLPVADDSTQHDPKVQIYSPSDVSPKAAIRANSGMASLQEVLHAFPKGVRDAVAALLEAEANASPVAFAARGSAGRAEGAVQAPDVPPPPFRGSAPSAQAMVQATITTDAEPVSVAQHLIQDADAALARQTLLQVASLPDRADFSTLRNDATGPRWNFEVPFATPQGTAVAQFEISSDGGGVEADAARRVWRARFSLNVEPSGPVHALVTLSGERASVRMWAERSSTAAQLRANVPQLTHALREAALEPGDIVIGDGAPAQPVKPPAGHFLDRAL